MKSRAIVLHTLKYNDTQIIANVLTEEMGCVGMIVRISRTKRATVRHALFQPLAILDIEWEHRPKATLQNPQPYKWVIHSPHSPTILIKVLSRYL